LIGHTGSIPTAVFSPDGKLLLPPAPQYARLWDVQTGKNFDAIGHTAVVENVAFSPMEYISPAAMMEPRCCGMWTITAQRYLCSHLLRDFTDNERKQYGITDATPTCPQNQNSSSAP
jgi:WD40 repeat protein